MGADERVAQQGSVGAFETNLIRAAIETDRQPSGIVRKQIAGIFRLIGT